MLQLGYREHKYLENTHLKQYHFRQEIFFLIELYARLEEILFWFRKLQNVQRILFKTYNKLSIPYVLYFLIRVFLCDFFSSSLGAQINHYHLQNAWIRSFLRGRHLLAVPLVLWVCCRGFIAFPWLYFAEWASTWLY